MNSKMNNISFKVPTTDKDLAEALAAHEEFFIKRKNVNNKLLGLKVETQI